jgi:hypothetical protein
VTLLVLVAVLSTADVGAARTACAVSRAHVSTRPFALAKRVTAAPREKTAVRTEAPQATLVAAYCASPQRRASAAYSKPALTRRAASAAPRSERAPPLSHLT